MKNNVQKTLAPGTRVRIFRQDGTPIEGVIVAEPVPWLNHFGEWYRVYRSAPVRYETKKGKGRGRHTEVDIADEIGLYPRYRLMEVG